MDDTPKYYARIRWLTPSEGGRKYVPEHIFKYATIVLFYDPRLNIQDYWTLMTEFLEPPSTTRYCFAEVRFLFETAPMHALFPGSEFALCDGIKPVALGTIMGDTLQDNWF